MLLQKTGKCAGSKSESSHWDRMRNIIRGKYCTALQENLGIIYQFVKVSEGGIPASENDYVYRG